MSYDYDRERQEAIAAGKRAKDSLMHAQEALNNARSWGIYDIIGGGFISTIIKHRKMDQASELIEKAKADLISFGHELDDIREYANIDLSTGDFWGFADWFFDGLLSDWVMQDRINEARRQVQEAINKVDSVLESIN